MMPKDHDATGIPGERVTVFPGQPLIKIAPGQLSQMATQAEGHLIRADMPCYRRGDTMVRPITEDVVATNGRKTTTAALQPITETYMRDLLCREINWEQRRGRDKKSVPADAPREVACFILERAGEWKFKPIAGIITTPTLRPDGTVLSEPGYDPSTQLFLAVSLPLSLADKPTFDEAARH